jgi:nanoRNase/pAp phosphatase (c-di-AMP/oligoRNAs hydrolase)
MKRTPDVDVLACVVGLQLDLERLSFIDAGELAHLRQDICIMELQGRFLVDSNATAGDAIDADLPGC